MNRLAYTELNERQPDMLKRLLSGFEGKPTSSNGSKPEKCSHDTALPIASEIFLAFC